MPWSDNNAGLFDLLILPMLTIPVAVQSSACQASALATQTVVKAWWSGNSCCTAHISSGGVVTMMTNAHTMKRRRPRNACDLTRGYYEAMPTLEQKFGERFSITQTIP